MGAKERETAEEKIDVKALGALVPDMIAGKGYGKLALAVARDEMSLDAVQQVARAVEVLRGSEDPEMELDALAERMEISLPVYGFFMRYLLARSREARRAAQEAAAVSPSPAEALPRAEEPKRPVAQKMPLGEMSEAEREKVARDSDVSERRRKRAQKQTQKRAAREERKRLQEEERAKSAAASPQGREPRTEARVKRENPLTPVIAEYLREKDALLAEYGLWRDVPAEEQGRLKAMRDREIFQPLFNQAYEATFGFTREAADEAGELRETFDLLPKWERDRFRQELGTAILTQGELPEEERGDVRALLEGVRFYFRDYSYRTMNAAYQAYEILARRTGFELRQRFRDPAPTHSMEALDDLRREAERAAIEDPDLGVDEYQTLDAARHTLFNLLRRHGPPAMREDLEGELQERRAADAEGEFRKEVAELFARELPAMQTLYREWSENLRAGQPATKEEFLARIEDEMRECQSQTRETLRYDLPEKAIDAEAVIGRLLRLRERLELLGRERQKIEKGEIPEQEAFPLLELGVIKAHILENAAKKRRAEAEALREELRSRLPQNRKDRVDKETRIRIYEDAARKLEMRAERELRGEAEEELPSADEIRSKFALPELETEQERVQYRAGDFAIGPIE